MIRKIVSIIKKWASGQLSKATAQETTDLGELDFQAQRDPCPNTGQENTPAELDEDTANETVVTWNLLNPP